MHHQCLSQGLDLDFPPGCQARIPIISDALWPTMVPPSTTLVAGSETTLAKPLVLPWMTLRGLAAKGTFVTWLTSSDHDRQRDLFPVPVTAALGEPFEMVLPPSGPTTTKPSRSGTCQRLLPRVTKLW